MTGEYFRWALLALLCALLVTAAVTDLRARIISNRLNLAIALLAPLYWMTWGLAPWPDMAIQLLSAVIVFVLFALLFAVGGMGGGDVKLLAALALWLPWPAMVTLVVLMALLGGALTIVTVVHHKWTHGQGRPEIPYGLAITAAALWVIGEPYFNQFA